MGMVSEPRPKPKAQTPTQPAAAGAPPANDVKGKLKKEQNGTVALPLPSVPAVSLAKGSTQRQQYSSSQCRQLSQLSGVQQRHTCQQQQQAYYGLPRSPTIQDEDEEEEDSGEETDSDEDDDDEEQPDPRYNPQNK